jgi:23S rRNA pseudouridine2605 synthase
MKKKSFGPFQGEKGSKKKERIRQEKKAIRRETKEYFEKKKEEERKTRQDYGANFDSRNTRPAPARKSSSDKPRSNEHRKSSFDKPRSGERNPPFDKSASRAQRPTGGKTIKKVAAQTGKPASAKATPAAATPSGPMPLNKFVAHSGICSRRDAAELVKNGMVTVNGETVLEPGFKVTGTEDIKVNGKKISARKTLVYILLNKPKDFITTMEDPEGRKTVFDIVKKATTERIYPIGRLDRNTTGVLLMTNDGELAQKLSHPSYQVKKIYEVKLDKPLAKKDFDELLKGVTLEDGHIAPDGLAYADPKDRSVIGIEIHSGRNRIVRRIFEHLGYDVRNLDRVMYANLTKKNVDRGKWRFLSEKEVRLLKFLNSSYTRK